MEGYTLIDIEKAKIKAYIAKNFWELQMWEQIERGGNIKWQPFPHSNLYPENRKISRPGVPIWIIRPSNPVIKTTGLIFPNVNPWVFPNRMMGGENAHTHQKRSIIEQHIIIQQKT